MTPSLLTVAAVRHECHRDDRLEQGYPAWLGDDREKGFPGVDVSTVSQPNRDGRAEVLTISTKLWLVKALSLSLSLVASPLPSGLFSL